MNVLDGQNYIKNKEFKKALKLFSNLEKSDTKKGPRKQGGCQAHARARQSAPQS